MTTTFTTRPSAGNVPESAHDRDFSWDILCSRTARVFRLENAEIARLRDSSTARLIAALPYVAGCQEAERTAFGHLCLYMAEIRAGHGPGDHTGGDEESLMGRLRMLADFKGGDACVIDHGMKLLAFVMVQGYNRSRREDAEKGIRNPFANGAWDYDTLNAALASEIEASPCEPLDAILSIKEPDQIVW